MEAMASKYDQETKDRVLRMFEERRSEAPEESQSASFRRLHELTGIPVDTMRGWFARAQIDAGERPGLTTTEREEIKILKKENAELRRANEILKTASAFFAAAELDRKLK
jgi:transposase